METEPVYIYYESKVQYLVVATAMVLFSCYLTFLDVKYKDIGQYLLGISSFAFILMSFYKVSTFYIYEDRFIWQKGWSKIECPWTDVLSINYDPERNTSFSTGYFKSSSAFFIETKNGLTKYADKTNIKLKGSYTFSSKGDELINAIKSKSKAFEQTGATSIFKQTQKLRDVILLLSSVFIVPVIIFLLYAFFTKDYSVLHFF